MGKVALLSAFSVYQQQLKKGKSKSKSKKLIQKKKLTLPNNKSKKLANSINVAINCNSTSDDSPTSFSKNNVMSVDSFFMNKTTPKEDNLVLKKKSVFRKTPLKISKVSKKFKLKANVTAADNNGTPKKKLRNTKRLKDEKVSLKRSIDTYEFYNRPYELLCWMIAPITPDDFFEMYWEKKPFHIRRSSKFYYGNILSTKKLDSIFRKNSLFFTSNVDVVSYMNGQRETHNPEGRAVPAVLWDYYQNGCSIRVLNPQTYCHKLHALLATLQEYFGCMVGVNTYLTPPDSQGFAPHYDDIEAFVLQLEGRKHWKLYAPLTPEEILPRFSSQNLDQTKIGKPIKEITLEAGDLLYFPRGIIHEGSTDAGAHSLHVTISVYQRTAYVDLLEHIFRPALLQATQSDAEFREGLPVQYLQHLGFANENNFSTIRDAIIDKVKSLFNKLTNHLSVDNAADQLGKQFMWDAMPPIPSRTEKHFMVHKDSEKMEDGQVHNKTEISLNVEIRLFRYHCLRLVVDDRNINNIRIYYCTDNAKEYQGGEQQFLVMEKKFAPAIKHLIKSYPHYIVVESLPLEDDTDKMQIVADLWERGLLVTEQSLQCYN